ncbi:MAG: 30S ribosome-binding factor RbfA [Bacteroidota bacterium]
MSTIRQNKVAALLQKELGNFFLRESKTYFAGAMITVTVVRVSPDLGYAKVYLSIFGVNNREEVFHFIESQNKEIRYKIGKEVGKQLRVVPELSFFYDDSLDYAEGIDKLLKK